jgi:hypothetical protein
MTIHEYAWKAKHDDALRAGERGRLLLEARRAREQRARSAPAAPVPRPAPAPVSRLARLLFRWATAEPNA